MKLATLRDGTRDGRLLVVRRDGQVFTPAPAPWTTLQGALDRWERAERVLRAVAEELDRGSLDGMPVDPAHLAAPLPRAYARVDGASHRGSDDLLGPRDPIALADEAWRADAAAQLCAILDDVPRGTRADDAERHVVLLLLALDVAVREPAAELATAFAPLAVAPDALGDAWEGGRVRATVRATCNGERLGDRDAAATESFHPLVARLAAARRCTAGTVLGAGPIAAPDPRPLRRGDTIEIEARLADGTSPFGAIRQRVEGGSR